MQGIRAGLGAAFAILFGVTDSKAGKHVAIEAVNDYSLCSANPEENLTNSVADAAGFQSNVVYFVAPYLTGETWFDDDSWASDFRDNDSTGHSYDHDYLYFDKRGNVASYFSGHGVCENGDTTNDRWDHYYISPQGPQSCTASSQCTTPPVNVLNGDHATNPGFCLVRPGDSAGTCSYTYPKRAGIAGNPGYTGSCRFNFGNGEIKWGESYFTPSTYEGSVGGTNMVAMQHSCGVMSLREHELFPAFAGMHMLAVTLVHTGDSLNTANRGPYFGACAENPNTTVDDCWHYAIASLGDMPQQTFRCTDSTGYEWGGGYGSNGCGGHETFSLGASAQETIDHMYETWLTAMPDSPSMGVGDAQGQAWMSTRISCNYNCFMWPFAL